MPCSGGGRDFQGAPKSDLPCSYPESVILSHRLGKHWYRVGAGRQGSQEERELGTQTPQTEKDGAGERSSYNLEALIKILEENVTEGLSIFLLRHLT